MGEWKRTTEKGRIERYAQSFWRLAEVFEYLPSKKETFSEEDLQEIYDTARNNVCSRCGRREDCWGKNEEKTVRLVYDMLEMIAESGSNYMQDITQSGIYQRTQERFLHHCIKGYLFREELQNCFYRAKLDMMWCNRMLENRAALAQQLQETAQIIEEIACTVYDEGEPDASFERRLRARLALLRIWVKEIRAVTAQSGCRRIVLTASTMKGCCVPVKNVAQIISELKGVSYVAERDSRLTIGHELCTIHFVEETNYYMLTAAATETACGQPQSGDNFAVLTGNHGQVILGISDGMGSGVKANQDSQTVIELLEQFLSAGFSAETTIRMINSAMILKRGTERFSTLDICGVNLYSGKCEFLKVGAASTFIRHAGWVETITSTSLPVGILRQADYECTKRTLEHGDMIVMVSDGVLDALPQERAEEIMKYLILQLDTDNPGEFSHMLMDRLMEFSDCRPADDMTILAGGFWKK